MMKEEKSNRIAYAAFSSLVLYLVTLQAVPNNVFTRRSTRFVFASTRESSLEGSIKLMQRAKNVGYNIAMADGIFFPTASKLAPSSLNRIKRLRAAADQIGIHLMPMSLGQLDPSKNDIQHAEAFSVPQQEFVVAGGQARPVTSPVAVPNAGFEEWNGLMPVNWKTSGMSPGVNLFRDTDVVRSGMSSIRGENPNKKSLCIYTYVDLKPNRVYEISAWIKTEGMANSRSVGIEVLQGHDWLLCIRDTRGVLQTQNWRRHAWAFHSKQYTKVMVRLAFSYFHFSATGKVWFDKVEIKEMGLSSAQRRSTTPVSVFSADTKRKYVEAKDYTVKTDLKNPLYDGYLELPTRSAIKEGEKLLVDWYHITRAEMITPSASFCHQEVWDLLRTNTQVLMEASGKPQTWFLKPSEWRTAFWDAACIAQYQNAGRYMGAVLRKEVELLREFNPDIETYVWNDAYDPYHNARAKYFHINPIGGGALFSWETMDPRTIVKVWNPNYEKSLRFFAGKDPKYPTYKHPQMGCFLHGYGIEDWLKIIDEFEREYPQEKDVVVGVHYTTWSSHWDGLEPMAETCKKSGRWMDNSALTPIQFDEASISTRSGKPQKTNALWLDVSALGIQYQVPKHGHIRITVRNAAGQTVAAPANEVQKAGNHHIAWSPKRLGTGVYFVHLAMENNGRTSTLTKRTVVMR